VAARIGEVGRGPGVALVTFSVPGPTWKALDGGLCAACACASPKRPGPVSHQVACSTTLMPMPISPTAWDPPR